MRIYVWTIHCLVLSDSEKEAEARKAHTHEQIVVLPSLFVRLNLNGSSVCAIAVAEIANCTPAFSQLLRTRRPKLFTRKNSQKPVAFSYNNFPPSILVSLLCRIPSSSSPTSIHTLRIILLSSQQARQNGWTLAPNVWDIPPL